jgi:hypothetical protein
VVLVALLAFTFTIGSGHLSGPGISLALSAGALVLVARFLFQSAKVLVASSAGAEVLEQRAASGRRRKELEREYYNLKRALKELELDHAMNKVSEVDYQEVRSRYRERAVRVLRQLDQGESYRAQIEADLRARRAALGLGTGTAPTPLAATPAAPVAAAPAPVATAAPVAGAAAPAAAAPAAPVAAAAAAAVAIPPAAVVAAPAENSPATPCPTCQIRNDSDAVFCKKCGHRLIAA